MKNDRLFAITYTLLHKKTVTASSLSKDFGVSIRTIYRDIETLSANGIPIYCTQGKGGGISIMGHYSIDKALLSDAEQNEILMALQGASVTGHLNLKPSISKLSGIFQKEVDDWIEIDFTGWSQTNSTRSDFETIKRAIQESFLLSFSYYNNKGKESTRNVQPYKLIYKGTQWYLYAYCMDKCDYRYFKLNRLKNLSLTQEKFKKHTDIMPSLYYKEDTKEQIHLTLKIQKEMAFRVYDEFGEATITDNMDHFIVNAKMPLNNWLIQYLLGYGASLEILEPKSLREAYKSELNQVLNKYL